MAGPPDFKFLAEQILAFTRVDWDPKNPQVGEQVAVQVIPGILPFVPPEFAGTTGPLGGLGGGPVSVALNALVHAIKFKVKYSVTTDGKPGKFKQTSLSAASLPDSDPLQALFLIAPKLIEDRLLGTKVTTELVVTVTVEVEGQSASAPFKIPLPIPPIPLPTFLVLTGGDEPGENKVFVMVRTGSTLKDVNGAVTTINSVVQALNSVKDVLDLGNGFVPLVGSLTSAVDIITGATSVAGFATEAAPDLDDFNDFDDEANSSLLFGPVGTAVEFFSGEDYNALFAGENEKSTFKITDDFGGSVVTTGFGQHRVTDWTTRPWDTDSSETMEGSCESCRFV
jgi:hypothetical protein